MKRPGVIARMERESEDPNRIHLVSKSPVEIPKRKQETPENREAVSQATMNYLHGLKEGIDEIYEWFLQIRPLVERLGESHKQNDHAARRIAQNNLWQSFQETVWQKKLLLNTQGFQGSAEDQKEQAGLFERWEKEITKNESPQPKVGEPKMPAAKNLAVTLYQDLEQHWLTESLPEDLYKFPFRISVWMERIGKAKAGLQNILKQVEVFKS